MQRFGDGGAAALGDSHDEIRAAGLERQPQRGRRRLVGGASRTKKKSQAAAGLRGESEALQLGVASARQPGHERLACRRAQHLLRRPKDVVPASRLDDDDLGEI